MQKRLRNITFFCILLLSIGKMSAQYVGSGSSVFTFLDMPASARLNALGGSNVGLNDEEVAFSLCNPALLSSATHQQLEMNYCYLMQGTMFGSVVYGHNFGQAKLEKPMDIVEKPNYFAVGIHYLDYGKMKYADAQGNLTGGTFGARDILINIAYARQLSPLFKVGVSLKPIISNYESYTSFALGADVGGHFQTKDSTFQMGLTLQNIGWQLKGFYSDEGGQKREMLPLNLQLGLSYRVAHAPLRFGLTIHNIQRYNLGYQFTNPPTNSLTGEIVSTDIKWYDMLFRHTIWFIDIVPQSNKFYLTLSYNHRRRMEMRLQDQRSLAGFALGGGVRLSGVHVGFSLSQLTRKNLTYQASIALDINTLRDTQLHRVERVPLTPEQKAEEKARKAEERARQREERNRRQEEFAKKLSGL